MIPVFVPFTFIHPPTWQALSYVAATPWPVDDGNLYLGYFRHRWAMGGAFTNVEHDVVVVPGQLGQLERCPEEWCVFPEAGGSPSLSLARFRPGFITANRGLWDEEWVLPSGQGKSWTWLDSHLVAHADRKPCLHLDPPANNTRPGGPLH